MAGEQQAGGLSARNCGVRSGERCGRGGRWVGKIVVFSGTMKKYLITLLLGGGLTAGMAQSAGRDDGDSTSFFSA